MLLLKMHLAILKLRNLIKKTLVHLFIRLKHNLLALIVRFKSLKVLFLRKDFVFKVSSCLTKEFIVISFAFASFDTLDFLDIVSEQLNLSILRKKLLFQNIKLSCLRICEASFGVDLLSEFH